MHAILKSPYRQYMEGVLKYPLLSREEEIELANLIKKGNAEDATDEDKEIAAAARERMINCNLRLVVKIAGSYSNDNLDKMDIIQYGNSGLMTAVDKFDPAFGTRFSTVAVQWIRAAITKALKDYSKTIRIPVHIWDAQSKVRKAIEELTQNGHEPTTAEICAKTGLSELDLSNLEAWKNTTVSLDTPISDEGEDTLGDLQADNETKTPYEYAEEKALKKDIQDGLDEALDARSAKIIRMRFGLAPYDREYTLEEVGAELGLTRERIRQIEKKSLVTLRDLCGRRFEQFRK